MEHWSEYEPYEITREFHVQCVWCEKLDDVEITAHVWRDGSVYGDWECKFCGGDNSNDDIDNVANFVDHDSREGK